MQFTKIGEASCFFGPPARNFSARTHDDLLALLCSACQSDVKCEGWAVHGDNSTTQGGIYHRLNTSNHNGLFCSWPSLKSACLPISIWVGI